MPHEAGHSEGAHRVEDAEEVHLGRMAVVVLELLDTRPEGAFGHVRALVHVDRLGQSLLDERQLGEQSDARDHAGHRARRVGAAAEADDEDLVARFVVLGEEPVAGDHVVEEPEPERTTQHPVGRVAPCADPADVVHELVGATGRTGVALHCARELLDVGDGLVVRLVPGPVAADHQPLHAFNVPDPEPSCTTQSGGTLRRQCGSGRLAVASQDRLVRT